MDNTWTWDSDYSRAYAPTSDPRILAIIERESYPLVPDGDALCPAYYLERGRAERAGTVFHDSESDYLAQRYAQALDSFYSLARWDDDRQAIAARWLRIFHDSRAQVFSAGYKNDTTILLLDTPSYRTHVGRDSSPDGATIHKTWTDNELFAGDREEWTAYLDGDVFGIGYAYNSARVTDETPLPDNPETLESEGWTVEIECWGFYGERYAQESALSLESGSPDLPDMLDIDALAGA